MTVPVAIITAKGDVGLREMRRIGAAIDGLIKDVGADLRLRPDLKIIIECSAADSIDTLAVGALLMISECVAQSGGEIKFARTGKFLQATLNRYGLKFFEHYASLEDAILSFDEEWSGDETTSH